jgi:hypothetical protein
VQQSLRRSIIVDCENRIDERVLIDQDEKIEQELEFRRRRVIRRDETTIR